MSIVRKTFTKLDGSRRIEIFERPDGTFGFDELAFGRAEDAWFPVGAYSTAIVDSLDHAIAEAKGRIVWMSCEPQGGFGPHAN
jgi:hypothetical protein